MAPPVIQPLATGVDPYGAAPNQAAQLQYQIAMAPTTSTTSTTGTEATNQIFNKQLMDPNSLAALHALIGTLSSGGTPQQKAEMAKKRQTQQLIEGLLGQFTTSKAQADAQQLMALNLQQAMQKNMPQIQRAIEGAGTSGSSMQGLLTQNMARDAALAAGALGAEQAKAYGGITANLAGQLSGLAQNAMDPTTQALIQALNISKGATESGFSQATGTKSTNQKDASSKGLPGVSSMSGSGGGVGYGSQPSVYTTWVGPDAGMNPTPPTQGLYGGKMGDTLYNLLANG